MDLSSLNELGQSAWADCLDLYQDTIFQLNRSIGSRIFHAQTWLSAAIANEQACQNGFLDFNLSSPFIMISDFPKLLRNSLAINRLSTMGFNNDEENHDHFPEWISAVDRKLLSRPFSALADQLADIVVAKDGSGDYMTICEGLEAAHKQRNGSKRFVIYVKKGVYEENVEIKKSMKNLVFIGDGIDETIVTGNKNVQDGSTTFRSATFAVSGDGFIARGITFENTAGPEKHQAVALRSDSDFSVFYKCSFKGHQDTLYVHSQRQFYRDCDIYGTVDFIFGDALSVFQNCNIYLRRPLTGQKNTVTAQGRKDPNENTAIVIHNSRIMASSEFGRVEGLYKSYLGRPWKEYSRTVIMKCWIDGVIDPAGWAPWSGEFGLSTLYYGEYMNMGRGARVEGRVKWPGFHVIRSEAVAGSFSASRLLAGDEWIPASGVPFTSGL
ncbi:probable pectinesterase/pectinesterase inhibitor 6 [Phtheirospermum japonicum]|uniref:Pectinesterase n=1 Tax=Phtheirospermum japonicum TaxID=374723 RepID=A0A830BHA0_9LAMI|nr:probable pectinesterase/pectinesterase inhibitor 6 [Phtheirospermum japonicum]